MDFTHDFFENEIRADFLIPSMIKRTWAAQLEVLSDLDAALKEKGMSYYAQWGTLLGTVRHRGFIPWDDDLDISMKRKDYNRLIENAKNMLPEGYHIVNYKSSDDFQQMLSRVVCSDHYRFDAKFMTKFSGLPFAVGIDIFPLDFLTDDEEYEENRWQRAYLVQSVIDKIVKEHKTPTPEELKLIELACGRKITPQGNVLRQLRELIESIYGEVDEKDAKYITLYPIWFSNKNYKFPKEYYEKTVSLQFENTSIPVPVCYEEVLKKNYGDSFMKQIRSGGAHDYPFCKNHINVLAEHFGYEWPKYDFEFKPVIERPQFSFDDYVFDMTASLRQNREDLQLCQSLAITMGSLIEKRFFEGSNSVKVLEEYCEVLYELSQTEADGEKSRAADALVDRFEEEYRGEFVGKKLILAVNYDNRIFDNLISVIGEYEKDPNNRIKIVRIPRIEIEPSMQGERVVYENEVSLQEIPYEEFDFAVRPDVIITGYGFDEYDLVTTVPKEFYIRSLVKNCNKLVYVMPYAIDRVAGDDERLMINLETIAVSPGVALADEVYVSSEDLRKALLQIMEKSADSHVESDDCRVYFEEKIHVAAKEACVMAQEMCIAAKESCVNSSGCISRKLVYFVGMSEFARYKEAALRKLSSSFEIFEQAKEKLGVIFTEEEDFRKNLEDYDVTLLQKYEEVLNKYDVTAVSVVDVMSAIENCGENEMILTLGNNERCEVAGYYGAPSHLASVFVSRKMPVMIRNVEILAD